MHNETRTEFRQLEITPTLSAIERLQRDRGYRDSRALFFIEGVRNFIEAVDHRFSVDTLLYSEKLLIHPLARKLVRRLKRAGVPFARVTPEQFRSVSKTERASGVAAILSQRVQTLDQVNLTENPYWTALSHVRSPGNLGTLMRTSSAVGATGFILIGESIDPFDPVVVRATMGTLFKQMIVRTTPERLRRWVRMNGIEVIGASPDGAEDYRKVSYARPAVLMLGSERKGLTDEQRCICNRMVRIPMVEGMDSLNVAVAGSLLMYEVFR
ncbi:MAG TPA: RNA methyltransferase [Blastocatellia bacterium]|nr:RNA methyltransferase [Blastocatellia bacterium]